MIAGITYAENVDDIRNSRSLDMIENVLWKKRKITIYDPVVKISSYKKIKIIKNLKIYIYMI